jgi:hypothetical protein
MIPVTKFTYGFLLFCTITYPILAGFTLADWAKEPTPEPPTMSVTLEERAIWDKACKAEVKAAKEGCKAQEKPLEPVEALRVKLLSKDTCPAHCICPTTKQLDVCLVTRGMCEKDLAYYKNIAPGGQGSPECFKLLDKYERLSAEYSEALDSCMRRGAYQ